MEINAITQRILKRCGRVRYFAKKHHEAEERDVSPPARVAEELLNKSPYMSAGSSSAATDIPPSRDEGYGGNPPHTLPYQMHWSDCVTI